MEQMQSFPCRAVPADAGLVELFLRNDFGAAIRFARYVQFLPAEDCQPHLTLTVEGTLPLPEVLSRGGVTLERCTFRDQPALRLYARIPTFDSYDRESDSWHALVLFGEGSAVHGVYCKGGYRLAHAYLCLELFELPEGLRACLAAEQIGPSVHT